MQLYLFRVLVVFFLLLSFAEASSKLYFLPQDSKKVEDKILKLFKNTQTSIDIAMYNFKYKKFKKALQKAKDQGVNIHLYLDKDKSKKSKIDFIKYKTFDSKLHIKAALFDNKTVVFGSANWKKESFQENMEVIYITDDKKTVKQFKDMFKKLSNY